MVVILLNPSPPVTLSEAKGLGFRLRVNSAKNLTQGVILNAVKDLMSSFAWLRAGSVKNLMLRHHPERSEGSHWFLRSAQDKLRLTPQNDITTQSLRGEGKGEGLKKWN